MVEMNQRFFNLAHPKVVVRTILTWRSIFSRQIPRGTIERRFLTCSGDMQDKTMLFWHVWLVEMTLLLRFDGASLA